MRYKSDSRNYTRLQAKPSSFVLHQVLRSKSLSNVQIKDGLRHQPTIKLYIENELQKRYWVDMLLSRRKLPTIDSIRLSNPRELGNFSRRVQSQCCRGKMEEICCRNRHPQLLDIKSGQGTWNQYYLDPLNLTEWFCEEWPSWAWKQTQVEMSALNVWKASPTDLDVKRAKARHLISELSLTSKTIFLRSAESSWRSVGQQAFRPHVVLELSDLQTIETLPPTCPPAREQAVERNMMRLTTMREIACSIREVMDPLSIRVN